MSEIDRLYLRIGTLEGRVLILVAGLALAGLAGALFWWRYRLRPRWLIGWAFNLPPLVTIAFYLAVDFSLHIRSRTPAPTFRYIGFILVVVVSAFVMTRGAWRELRSLLGMSEEDRRYRIHYSKVASRSARIQRRYMRERRMLDKNGR